MKRHATIVPTFALVAALGVCVPAPAGASAPLLSGYGGPGTGSQAILGSTLLGGGSSQGGGSGGNAGTGSEGAPSQVGGSGATDGASATRGSSTSAGGAGRGGRSSGPSAAGGSATHPGAAGANPQTPSLQTGQAAGAAWPAWLSGADVLALVLAAGALALVGLATVRLARTQHHQAGGRN